MNLRVAVDFGTSSTCVAMSVDGREPQVVVVDGAPLVPSAVFAAVDGTLFVGQEAERQAAIDPSRYEPNPKRRIDEGELLLGNTVISVLDVVRAVLGRAVGEARRLAGGARADLLVLTHPADWGALRTRVLRQAAAGLATEIALVPEPVAAAVFHAASHALPDGSALAVLDLGGGTVDASVVSRQPKTEPDKGRVTAGFRVLATHGDPNFGGADIDQLLLEHVGAQAAKVEQDAWRQLVEGREMADRRRRRVLRQDVRGAKETLSRHPYTDVPLPPPFPDAHVTRVDLEKLITEPLRRAAALTRDTIADAGVRPEAVFLVGGSSRIPLVARLVHEHTGIIPTTLDQPETVVARGALRAVTHDPIRTGGLPRAAGPMPSRPPQQPPPRQFPTPPRPYGPAQGRPLPPPPAPKPPSRTGKRLLWAGAGVLVVALVVTGTLIFTRSGSSATGASNPAPATTTTSSRQLAQYEYTFPLPADWAQSGGDATKLEVEITPATTPSGTTAIFVAETRLGYDSSANRQRAIGELQPQVTQAGYLGFNSQAQYAGRTVAYYQQPGNGMAVDWYVLFQGTVQVSIGCRYPVNGRAGVQDACQQVVAGLSIAG